jgi:hypothetical protein
MTSCAFSKEAGCGDDGKRCLARHRWYVPTRRLLVACCRAHALVCVRSYRAFSRGCRAWSPGDVRCPSVSRSISLRARSAPPATSDKLTGLRGGSQPRDKEHALGGHALRHPAPATEAPWACSACARVLPSRTQRLHTMQPTQGMTCGSRCRSLGRWRTRPRTRLRAPSACRCRTRDDACSRTLPGSRAALRLRRWSGLVVGLVVVAEGSLARRRPV